MLALPKAIGFLQRFMPHRNAAEWLENDRRNHPVLPFLNQGNATFYFEDDLTRFVQKITAEAVLRTAERRKENDRRVMEMDRRANPDRRRKRRQVTATNRDRRSATSRDRRGELDRRLRGWVDRRGTEDRRAPRLIYASNHNL